MILRLSGRLAGTIVIESVLIGSDEESLRPVGTLRLRPAEWQMLNAVIGVPVGGQHRVSFRPYATGGIGLMRMHVVSEPENPFVDNEHEVGWNVGGGAMALFGRHLGLRGDVRYVRSFQNGAPSWTRNVNVDVAPGNFDFFQATAGLTFRIPQ